MKDPSIHYILKDHLGSWTTITDAEGTVEQELSFDAWGNLRDPDTWTGYTVPLALHRPDGVVRRRLWSPAPAAELCNSGCDISCLIDTTLLLKECPAGFPDENSDEALYTQFDPYGKIYKVHNCDSLELI
jgi:hypothetical protein